jgi:hypothetical protein
VHVFATRARATAALGFGLTMAVAGCEQRTMPVPVASVPAAPAASAPAAPAASLPAQAPSPPSGDEALIRFVYEIKEGEPQALSRVLEGYMRALGVPRPHVAVEGGQIIADVDFAHRARFADAVGFAAGVSVYHAADDLDPLRKVLPRKGSSGPPSGVTFEHVNLNWMTHPSERVWAHFSGHAARPLYEFLATAPHPPGVRFEIIELNGFHDHADVSRAKEFQSCLLQERPFLTHDRATAFEVRQSPEKTWFVLMTLDAEGTRILQQESSRSIRTRFAVMIGWRVSLAPVVLSEIRDGQMRISPEIDDEEAARDLVEVLRRGPLPGLLYPINEMKISAPLPPSPTR